MLIHTITLITAVDSTFVVMLCLVCILCLLFFSLVGLFCSGVLLCVCVL